MTNEQIIPHDSTVKSEQLIGAFLKEQRTKKGKSLEIISQRTKINLSMLEILEKDDFQNLPNKAYVQGYIKSYAKELNLNEIDCLKILEDSYKQNNPVELPKNNHYSNHEQKKSTKVQIIITLSFLATAAIAIFLYSSNSKKIIPQKTVEIAAPVTVTAVPALENISTDKMIPITPTPAAAKELPKENDKKIEKVIPSKEVKKEAPIDLPKDVKKDTKVEVKESTKAITKEGQEFVIAKSPLFSYAADAEQKNATQLLPNKYKQAGQETAQNVFVNAVDGDTWLTYKKDGDNVKKVLLKQGQTLYIGGNEIRVFFGNINVSKLFYNGKLINPESRSGVKSLVFPVEAQEKYPVPLFVFDKDKSGVVTSDEYLKAKQPTNDSN